MQKSNFKWQLINDSIIESDKKALTDFINTPNQRFTNGSKVKEFEEKWSEHNSLHASAFSSWGGAALAALEFYGIKNKTVLCPSNTFMATPLSIINSGGNVIFADSNKDDLCLSYDSLLKICKNHLYAPFGPAEHDATIKYNKVQ